jgi:hypothetical protein
LPTPPEAVRRHDLRQAIPEGHLHTGGIETSPSCHSEHQLHGGALSRQVLQMTDTPAVAAVGAGATSRTPRVTGNDRGHDPASVSPIGRGHLDARAGRPLAIRFHEISTHCRRHAANLAPVAESHHLRQTPIDRDRPSFVQCDTKWSRDEPVSLLRKAEPSLRITFAKDRIVG